MVWFKKKKNKDKENDGELSNIVKNKVRIIIVSGVEDTPIQEDDFLADVVIDYFDGVKYMVNDDKNFKELYPERDDKYNFTIPGNSIKEKKDWLKNQIKELKKKLKDYKKNVSKDVNEKDIELRLKIFENRLLELNRGLDDREGSPVYIGKNGTRTFFFYRSSGELIPMRWDLRGNSIYKDIAYKKKQSVVAYQNLFNRYSSKIKRFVETSVIWLMVINIIFAVALGFGGIMLYSKYNQFSKMYDESNIAKLKTEAEKSVLWCGDVLRSQIGVVQNLTQLTQEQINLQNQLLINKNRRINNTKNG